MHEEKLTTPFSESYMTPILQEPKCITPDNEDTSTQTVDTAQPVVRQILKRPYTFLHNVDVPLKCGNTTNLYTQHYNQIHRLSTKT